jgi:glycine dehydrogenase subunit 1
MTMLGYEGLSRVAKASHANAKSLAQKLVAIEGVELLNKGPFFHEFMISVPGSAQAVLDGLAERSILGGVAVASLIDGADAQAILVCATEVKTTNDLDIYACALRDVLDSAGEV